MVKQIPLTQGFVALVDDEDFERVSRHSWQIRVWGSRHYAGTVFYERGTQKQTSVKMHRFILNAPPGFDVDHRDGDALNNTRANLRIATRSQNLMNARLKSNNTSGYKGVSLDKRRNRWNAYVRVSGRRKFLGSFIAADEAALAYDAAAREHYGEFARTNF